MFNVGDKVITHPAGTIGTVTERLYRVENVHGTCVMGESELKSYVSPEKAWLELAAKVGSWVESAGVPLWDDEWARIGNWATDFLKESGIEATDQDKATINLLITASVAAIPDHPF
jgi:hypothetical protein